jgi:hypothetical protein
MPCPAETILDGYYNRMVAVVVFMALTTNIAVEAST